jgi:hypothetical protein
MAPHLLRCQGFTVGNYSFTLGRLEAGVPPTFAQLGSYNLNDENKYDRKIGVRFDEYGNKLRNA